MKTLRPSAMFVGFLILVALLGSILLLLYALFFGRWVPFFWAAGVSLALFIATDLLAGAVLDDSRHLLAAAMLWELVGGMFGWAWIAMTGAAFVFLVKALFFQGAWSKLLICLVAGALFKWLTRYSMTTQEAATFKRELVEQGMTKAEARKAWIARSQEILRQRKLGSSDHSQ